MEMRMEMKASLCVGEYCETAYNIEELEIRVYCMEELCYCLKENAFLLDMSIMNDKLVDWIGEECRVRELAKQLYPMVHKQGSLSVFVLTILQYVGIYGEEELQAVAQVLKQGSGLSNLEKRKSQIDYMVEKRKYAAAIRGYDMLLETWSDLEREGRELPAGKVRAAILHNKGVALTGLMPSGCLSCGKTHGAYRRCLCGICGPKSGILYRISGTGEKYGTIRERMGTAAGIPAVETAKRMARK